MTHLSDAQTRLTKLMADASSSGVTSTVINTNKASLQSQLDEYKKLANDITSGKITLGSNEFKHAMETNQLLNNGGAALRDAISLAGVGNNNPAFDTLIKGWTTDAAKTLKAAKDAREQGLLDGGASIDSAHTQALTEMNKTSDQLVHPLENTETPLDANAWPVVYSAIKRLKDNGITYEELGKNQKDLVYGNMLNILASSDSMLFN